MSKLRQSGGKYEGAQIVTFSCEFANGHFIPEHSHSWDQFVYGCHGVMTVRTARSIWVVPPQRAVWVPAGVPHAITMSGAVTMKTLYLVTGLASHVLRDCCVLNVSSLMRELVLHACEWEMLSTDVPEQSRFIGVLLDQIQRIETIPFQLPNLADARAARVAARLLENPGDGRTVSEICAEAGASRRTIERLFQAETGMTVGKWRQQLSLLHAVRLLAGGSKVTAAAMDAGYSSPSAFISMFRKTLGTTPGNYFSVAVL